MSQEILDEKTHVLESSSSRREELALIDLDHADEKPKELLLEQVQRS
jgi:hypothetical protein